ncbi:hypothetical protein [Lysobacter olei]
MTRPNENALIPASLAADGNQGAGANAGGVGTAEHIARPTLALSQAVAMLGTAAEFLDVYARVTDDPGPGIVEATDLLHAARLLLSQGVTA